MASKVFLHIGLPKTGTTYLQTIMWSGRDLMRAQGVLLPGEQRRDHLWASRVVRDDPRLADQIEKQRTAWDRLRAEVADWDGTAVISHEFFAAASAPQAAAMIEALAPAEVHLVVTAREPAGLFTSSWQESLKNGGVRSLATYAAAGVSQNPMSIWNWRTLDVGLVLDRWAATVPAQQVHVIPLPPPGSPRTLVWDRFATLIGLDPGAFDDSESFANESLGVVEAETLRRINLHLQDKEFSSAMARGTFIRTFLADERLAPRGGDRYWPEEGVIEECRRRGTAAVTAIAEAGYDVRGDLDDLLVPETLPVRRGVDSVTDAEVAEAAVELVGTLMHDVRRLVRQRDKARRRAERALAQPLHGGLLWRLRRLVRRN